MGYRRLKADILDVLQRDDFQLSLVDELNALPRQKVNPLFSLLYHDDTLVRWRSIAAMGHVVSQLAATDRESARVVMRRLMWNLNDESGGMGWGSPEAMAEIMAREHGLAEEYAAILVSYLNPLGNFLEHEGLQRGVLWGVGRLGRSRTDLVEAAAPHLLSFLKSPDPGLRGLAVWAAVPINDETLRAGIQNLQNDSAAFTLFWGNSLQTMIISSLVARPTGRPTGDTSSVP
jgi:hypothetical protein